VYVSVTEVQSFKRCRRQWEYGSFNRMGITPIMQPKPYLDLGSMVHKTLAYWTEKPDLGTATLQQVFLNIAAQHRRGVLDAYQKATGQTPSLEDQAPLLDAITLGAAMMANYQEYYKVPLPAHLQYCAPEQEILIPIPGTEHKCTQCSWMLREVTHIDGVPVTPIPCSNCNDTGTARHHLKARLDALAIDRRDNLYVVERKTYEKRPDLNLLEVNDQFIGYVWVAQQTAMGNVVGIAYDGMWKRATPPQRPKKLGIEDLFVRTIIQPSQDEIEEYGVELASTVMEMANSPYIYKNRVWQGCWDCSFEYLCRTQSQGGDVDYVLRTMYTKRNEDDTSDIVQQVEATPLIGV
jgi:hypothetical protein